MPIACSLVSHMGNVVMTRSFTIVKLPRSKNELRQLLIKQDLRLEEMPFTFTGKLPPYGSPVDFTCDNQVVQFFSKSHDSVVFDVMIESGGMTDVLQQLKLVDNDFVKLHIFPLQVDEESDVIEQEFFIPEKNVATAMARTIKRTVTSKKSTTSALKPGKEGKESHALSTGMNLEVSLILKNNEPKPLDNNDEEVKAILRQHAERQAPVRVAYQWTEAVKGETHGVNTASAWGGKKAAEWDEERAKMGEVQVDSSLQGASRGSVSTSFSTPSSSFTNNTASLSPKLPSQPPATTTTETADVSHGGPPPVRSVVEQKHRPPVPPMRPDGLLRKSAMLSTSGVEGGSPRPPSVPLPLSNGTREGVKSATRRVSTSRRLSLSSFSSTEVSPSKAMGRVSPNRRPATMEGGRGKESEKSTKEQRGSCSPVNTEKKETVENPASLSSSMVDNGRERKEQFDVLHSPPRSVSSRVLDMSSPPHQEPRMAAPRATTKEPSPVAVPPAAREMAHTTPVVTASSIPKATSSTPAITGTPLSSPLSSEGQRTTTISPPVMGSAPPRASRTREPAARPAVGHEVPSPPTWMSTHPSSPRSTPIPSPSAASPLVATHAPPPTTEHTVEKGAEIEHTTRRTPPSYGSEEEPVPFLLPPHHCGDGVPRRSSPNAVRRQPSSSTPSSATHSCSTLPHPENAGPTSPTLLTPPPPPLPSHTAGRPSAIYPSPSFPKVLPPPPFFPSSLASQMARRSPKSPGGKGSDSPSSPYVPYMRGSGVQEFSGLPRGSPVPTTSSLPVPPNDSLPSSSARAPTLASSPPRKVVSQSSPTPLMGRRVLPGASNRPGAAAGGGNNSRGMHSRSNSGSRSWSSGAHNSELHPKQSCSSVNNRSGSLHDSIKELHPSPVVPSAREVNNGAAVEASRLEEKGCAATLFTAAPCNRNGERKAHESGAARDAATKEACQVPTSVPVEPQEELSTKPPITQVQSSDQGRPQLEHHPIERPEAQRREERTATSSPTNRLVSVTVLLFFDDEKGSPSPSGMTSSPSSVPPTSTVASKSVPGTSHTPQTAAKDSSQSSSSTATRMSNASCGSNESSFYVRSNCLSREFKFFKNTTNLVYQFKKWCSLEKDLFKATPFPEEICMEIAVGSALHPVKKDTDLLEWVALSREAQRPLRVRLTLSKDQLSSLQKPVSASYSSTSSSSSIRLHSTREPRNNSFCCSLAGGAVSSGPRTTTGSTPILGLRQSSPSVHEAVQEGGGKGVAEDGSRKCTTLTTTSTSTITVATTKGVEDNSLTLLSPPGSSPFIMPARKSVTISISNGVNTSTTVHTSGIITGGISSSSSPRTSSPLTGTTAPHASGNLGTVLPPLKHASPTFSSDGASHRTGSPLNYPPSTLHGSTSSRTTTTGAPSSLPSRTASPRSTAAGVQGTYPLHPSPLPSSRVYAASTTGHPLPPYGPLPSQGEEHANGNENTSTTPPAVSGTAMYSGRDRMDMSRGVEDGTVGGKRSLSSSSQLSTAEKQRKRSPKTVDVTSYCSSQQSEKHSMAGCSTGEGRSSSAQSSVSSAAMLPSTGGLQHFSAEGRHPNKSTPLTQEPGCFDEMPSYSFLRRSAPPVVCSVPSPSETLVQCFVKWDHRESLILCRLHKDFMLSDLKRAICYEFSAPPKTDSSTLLLSYKKIKEDKKNQQLTIKMGNANSDDQVRLLIEECAISSLTWEVCARGPALGVSSASGGGALLDHEVSLMAAEVVGKLGTTFRLSMLETLFFPAKKYFQNPSQQSFFETLAAFAREEKGEEEVPSWTVKEIETLLCRCFSDVQKDSEATEVCCTCLAVVDFCKNRNQALDRFFKSVYRNMRKTKGVVSVGLLNEVFQNHQVLLPPYLQRSTRVESGTSSSQNSTAEFEKAISEKEFLEVCLPAFELLPECGEAPVSPGPETTNGSESSGTRASRLLNALSMAAMEGIIRRSNFLDFPAPFPTESNFSLSSSTSVPAPPFPTPRSATPSSHRDGKGVLRYGDSHSTLLSSATWANVYSEQMKAALMDRCTPGDIEQFCWSGVQSEADPRQLVILSIIGALLAPSKEPLPPSLGNSDSHVRPTSRRAPSPSLASKLPPTSTTLSTEDYPPQYYVEYMLDRCKGKVLDVMYSRMLSFGSNFVEETRVFSTSPGATPPPPSGPRSSSSTAAVNGIPMSVTSRIANDLGKTSSSIPSASSRTPSPTTTITPGNGATTRSTLLPLSTLHHIVWALLSPSLDPLRLANDISPVAAALVEWAFAAVQLVCVVQKQVFPVMPPYHSQYVSLPLHPILYEYQERTLDK